MTPAPAPCPARTAVRLLIADDRPRARRALRALLGAHAGFEVVGEASDGEEALARVEALRPGRSARRRSHGYS
jgi:CheY-like chemotaxis protein